LMRAQMTAAEWYMQCKSMLCAFCNISWPTWPELDAAGSVENAVFTQAWKHPPCIRYMRWGPRAGHTHTSVRILPTVPGAGVVQAVCALLVDGGWVWLAPFAE
jgi:hypothetical protein